MPDEFYRGPGWWSLRLLLGAARRRDLRQLATVWVIATVLAVGLALLEARQGWSGIPVTIGSVTFGITIYPSLTITLLLTVWLGPGWGMVPAYLATLASGLSGGMSLPVATLFAVATPLELAIIWGSMVTLNIHPDLDRWRDLWRYLVVCLIAATASSLAVLIWNQTQRLDLSAGQRVWEGWVIGDFLQLVLVVAPVLHWLGTPARRWVDRRFGAPPSQTISYSRGAALVVLLFGLLGAMVFQGVGMLMDTLQIGSPATDALWALVREIGLFLGLLYLVTLLTALLFGSALARISERERSQGLRDALTGCYNRRAFRDLFQREAERSRRLQEGISVIFFDIDRFKEVNDRFGHEVGDEILRQLPRRVRGVMRDHDLLFRWGGEEFVALLPHTGPHDADHLAERIRQTVAQAPLLAEGVPRPIGITLSLGTAAAAVYPADPDRLLADADAASYRAKHAGRNRVESAATAALPA